MNQLIAPLFYSRLKEPKYGNVFYSPKFSHYFHPLKADTQPLLPPPLQPIHRKQLRWKKPGVGVGVGGCRSRILFMVAEVEKKWLGTRLGSNSNENGTKKGWKFEREKESPTTNFLFFHQKGQKNPSNAKKSTSRQLVPSSRYPIDIGWKLVPLVKLVNASPLLQQQLATYFNKFKT